MEEEPNSDNKNPEIDELLRIAQERTRLFYELLDRQAAASRGPNLIRKAIDEAMQRARPTEIVELPDDEQ